VPASGSFFPVGSTTVTCTATDGAGNQSTCSFAVTVNDTQPPVATCPGPIVASNDPGLCSAVVSYTATAADNCPGSTILCVPASGSAFVVGTTTVTCTATDAAGLTATCAFTVTVNDTEPPVATCPANITQTNDLGQCSAVVTFAATSSDNCPGQTVACVPASGTAFIVGTTTVTCTATDAAGLTGTCSFTVMVSDTEPPTAVAGSVDPCYTTVALAEAAAIAATTGTDNCGAVTFSASTAGTCPAVVTVTVTDGVGLTASVTYNTKIDNTPPVISAVTATQGTNDVEDCANVALQGVVNLSVEASDAACGLAGPPVITLVNGANPAESATFVNESPAGTFNYTWTVTALTANGTWTATVTATDQCNTSSDTFDICVNKTQITGLVQLESFIGTGTIPTTHTRTVTFVATDGPGAGATVLETWVVPLSNVAGDTFSYTLTDVPVGTTHLSAKTDWNKRKKLAATFDVNGQAVVNFTGADQVRGGDITGDNIVNLADYSLLVSHWLEVVAVTPAAAVADMNGDGVINFFDYVILGANWFTVGDPQ
jgi:hypothetical protein